MTNSFEVIISDHLALLKLLASEVEMHIGLAEAMLPRKSICQIFNGTILWHVSKAESVWAVLKEQCLQFAAQARRFLKAIIRRWEHEVGRDAANDRFLAE